MGILFYDVKQVSDNCFEVRKFNEEIHNVIYHPDKQDWTCDCEWATLRIGKQKKVNCVHVKAVWRRLYDINPNQISND